MNRNTISAIAVILIFVYLCQGCKKSSETQASQLEVIVLNLPSTLFNYAAQVLPAYLQAPPIRNADNTPTANPITNAGATLGRVLFYDTNLSLNRTVSCSSCHKQENGFADPSPLSKGFNGGNTTRNSMSLANAKFYQNGRFFWDERSASLEAQTLIPIQNEIEMGMSLPELTLRLQNLSYYPALFRNAFGDAAVTPDRISKALSQFIRSMISFHSKYDTGRETVADINTAFANFTAEENLGKQIFIGQGNCASCHNTDAFIAPGLRSNGLDITVTDGGAGAVNNNPNNLGQFKVPSLKNIALTTPYMHDGRFKTLDEVIEHYNSGVKNSPSLSPQLRGPNGNVRVLNLSIAQKSALKAFLLTLTDQTMITDEKFSDPFNSNK